MIPAVLDEILRAKMPIREDVFRKWQHAIRADVIPLIESIPKKLTRPPSRDAQVTA